MRSRSSILLLLFTGAALSHLQAATVFVGATSDFSNPLNWTNGVPSNANPGTIAGASVATYATGNALNNKTVSVEGIATLSGANMNLTNANLEVAGDAQFSGDRIRLGNGAGGGGNTTLTVKDNASVVASGGSDIVVGRNQVAEVDQQGGTVEATRNLTVGGGDGGADSKYTLTNGQVDVTNNMTVRRSSDFEVGGGTVDVGRSMTVRDTGSTYTQTGGDTDVTLNATFRTGSAGQLDGGNFSVGNNITIRDAGTALDQNGGTLSSGNNLTVRDSATLAKTDGVTSVARDLTVLNGGTTTQSGGSTNVTRDARLTDNGTVNMQGGSLNVGRNLRATNDNSTFRQTGGSVEVDNRLLLNRGSGNTYRLEGGTLAVEDRIVVSNTNSFLWEGGTLEVHPNATRIDFRGNVTAGPDARLDLKSTGQYLMTNGTITFSDLEVDGYETTLPSSGPSIQTGQEVLIQGGTLVGVESDLTFRNFTGFDSISLVPDETSFDATTTSAYWFDFTGNSVTLNWSLSPVPEPSAALLCLSGLLLLGVRRNR